MAIYVFNLDFEPIVDFTSDKAKLLSAIQDLSTYTPKTTTTNLNGAAVFAIDKLVALDQSVSLARRALVFFTDGTDSAGEVPESDVNSAIELATQNEILLYTVGLEVKRAHSSYAAWVRRITFQLKASRSSGGTAAEIQQM